MSRSVGRHRKNRTLSYGTVAVMAAGAVGVYLTAVPFGAGAATATVFVSTSGSDSAAGTLAAPYKTLGKALAVATAGTTIQVRGGTYYPASTLKSAVSGTSTSRITLQPYGSEKVEVDGSGLPSGSWLVGLYADYWTVRGIQFQNAPAHGFVCTSCTGGIFKNLTTNGNGDSGFTLRGDNSNNNLIQNLDSYGNYGAATHGRNADGLAINFGSGSGDKVTGTRLYNNSDDGLDLSKNSPAAPDTTGRLRLRRPHRG